MFLRGKYDSLFANLIRQGTSKSKGGVTYANGNGLWILLGSDICSRDHRSGDLYVASANVSGTYKKYNRVRNSRNMTGAQVAAQILQEAGLSHIRIEHISGDLTDHYDPSAKVLRLSDSVYGSNLDRSSWCGGA